MVRIYVYLDSNVIIDMIDGREDELLGLAFRSLYCGPYCYPFSAELISEIADRDHPERNGARMMLLQDLSKSVYFENSYTNIGFRSEDPSAVFELINEVEFDFDLYNTLANIISFDQISEVRTAFGFDTNTINNMEPMEAIRHIDSTLNSFDYKASPESAPPPRSLKDIIAVVSKISEDSFKDVGKGLSKKVEPDSKRKDLILLFSLLDTFGYWSDPRKKYVKGSRMSDAQHALAGSYFAALVSRDRHLVKKSEAIYKYLNINTKTYTTDDFKIHLRHTVNRFK